jgi:hypothetical protein
MSAAMSNMMKPRAKYGIDAPGVVRTHIAFGSLLALMATIGIVRTSVPPSCGSSWG